MHFLTLSPQEKGGSVGQKLFLSNQTFEVANISLSHSPMFVAIF